MGCLHSFELSPPWHGLTVFLKDVLYHHISRARVTPATLISEATLRHSYICFVQKSTCNMLRQHSRATKTTKCLLFHSYERRDKHHRRVLEFSWALARNKERVRCLLLHKHQPVFNSVSAASSSLSKKQLYRLRHERRMSGFCSWLMTSCCNASGLYLELNNFRKLIEELSKQEEGEKLQECILHL